MNFLFAPNGAFDIVGVAEDYAYHFEGYVWHGVLGYFTEVA